MSFASDPVPKLWSTWKGLIDLGFGLLCIRFLAATGRADWTLALLSAVGFGVAWWRPAASLFALLLSCSLLSGLQKTTLLAPHSVLLVVASAMWLGRSLRAWWPTTPRDCDLGSPPRPGWTGGLAALLATAALLSLAAHVWTARSAAGFWTQFWQQPHHVPGDPHYVLTWAFLWLHGLCLFRAMQDDPGPALGTSAGIRLVCIVNTVVMLLFFALQWLFDFPVRWIPGFESPYEDIATFGVMATVLAIFHCSQLRRGPARLLLLHGAAVILLLVAVAVSWSRGSWGSCLVFVGLFALVHLPRAVLIPGAAAVLGIILLLNWRIGPVSPVTQPYLHRVMSLIRFHEIRPLENSGRPDLYYKAAAMSRERPWTGHGAGSFYRTASRYARPGDPYAAMPQLPHNLLLQLAAEQGLPVAILFASLAGIAAWRGARCYLDSRRPQSAADPAAVPRSTGLLALGFTLMLGAYLQANMTWDILVLHPSQPFFFWFMVAALTAIAGRAQACRTAPRAHQPARPGQPA